MTDTHDILIYFINKNIYDDNDIAKINSIINLLDEEEINDYLLIASQHGNINFLKIFKNLNIELNYNNSDLLRESISYNNYECAKFLYNLYKNEINLEKYKIYSSYPKIKKMLLC